MTSLQLYKSVLVDLNKVDAPNVLLEDFNILANSAINNYINKRYNIYDVNQQTTDDLRVLKASVLLPVRKTISSYFDGNINNESDDNKYLKFMDATYEVILPNDYMHILNCICLYDVKNTYACYNKDSVARFPATRLTADLYSQVLDNFYTRPTYRRPYYYIHNVNKYPTNPTNPYRLRDDESNYFKSTLTGTDYSNESLDYLDESTDYSNEGTAPRSINLRDIGKKSTVQREAEIRYGNVSEVRMEIRYGTDDQTVFELKKVLVDYIKTPQHFRLTQDQLDLVKDTSQMLEFPDYVCEEIKNELVHLIMERDSDPRLQTHPIVTQSIANPVQQQTAQTAVQTA